MKHPIVMAISGASGAVYAVRLLDVLLKSGYDIHLTISQNGQKVLRQELSIPVDPSGFSCTDFCAAADSVSQSDWFNNSVDVAGAAGRLDYFENDDMMSPIASGSFLTAGMVVCPCSGSTLSALARGTSGNLTQRAADVHLKEGRKLVVVPREMPLSTIQIENMRRASQAGAIVMPAMPGWYHGVDSVGDLVDFVVGRILDQLGIDHSLTKRWGLES